MTPRAKGRVKRPSERITEIAKNQLGWNPLPGQLTLADAFIPYWVGAILSYLDEQAEPPNPRTRKGR